MPTNVEKTRQNLMGLSAPSNTWSAYISSRGFMANGFRPFNTMMGNTIDPPVSVTAETSTALSGGEMTTVNDVLPTLSPEVKRQTQDALAAGMDITDIAVLKDYPPHLLERLEESLTESTNAANAMIINSMNQNLPNTQSRSITDNSLGRHLGVHNYQTGKPVQQPVRKGSVQNSILSEEQVVSPLNLAPSRSPMSAANAQSSPVPSPSTLNGQHMMANTDNRISQNPITVPDTVNKDVVSLLRKLSRLWNERHIHANGGSREARNTIDQINSIIRTLSPQSKKVVMPIISRFMRSQNFNPKDRPLFNDKTVQLTNSNPIEAASKEQPFRKHITVQMTNSVMNLNHNKIKSPRKVKGTDVNLHLVINGTSASGGGVTSLATVKQMLLLEQQSIHNTKTGSVPSWTDRQMTPVFSDMFRKNSNLGFQSFNNRRSKFVHSNTMLRPLHMFIKQPGLNTANTVTMKNPAVPVPIYPAQKRNVAIQRSTTPTPWLETTPTPVPIIPDMMPSERVNFLSSGTVNSLSSGTVSSLSSGVANILPSGMANSGTPYVDRSQTMNTRILQHQQLPNMLPATNILQKQSFVVLNAGNIQRTPSSEIPNSRKYEQNQSSDVLNSGNSQNRQSSGILHSGNSQHKQSTNILMSENIQQKQSSDLLNAKNYQQKQSTDILNARNYQQKQSSDILNARNYQQKQSSDILNARNYQQKQSSDILNARNYQQKQSSDILNARNYQQKQSSDISTARNYQQKQSSDKLNARNYQQKQSSDKLNARNYQQKHQSDILNARNYPQKQSSDILNARNYQQKQSSDILNARNYQQKQSSDILNARNYQQKQSSDILNARNYQQKQSSDILTAGNVQHKEIDTFNSGTLQDTKSIETANTQYKKSLDTEIASPSAVMNAGQRQNEIGPAQTPAPRHISSTVGILFSAAQEQPSNTDNKISADLTINMNQNLVSLGRVTDKVTTTAGLTKSSSTSTTDATSIMVSTSRTTDTSAAGHSLTTDIFNDQGSNNVGLKVTATTSLPEKVTQQKKTSRASLGLVDGRVIHDTWKAFSKSLQEMAAYGNRLLLLTSKIVKSQIRSKV